MSGAFKLFVIGKMLHARGGIRFQVTRSPELRVQSSGTSSRSIAQLIVDKASKCEARMNWVGREEDFLVVLTILRSGTSSIDS